MEVKQAIVEALKEMVLPELKSLQSDIAQLKINQEAINTRLDDLIKRIDDINLHLVELSRRIDETNSRIDDTNNRID